MIEPVETLVAIEDLVPGDVVWWTDGQSLVVWLIFEGTNKCRLGLLTGNGRGELKELHRYRAHVYRRVDSFRPDLQVSGE